jgi:hypothetical protein
MDTLDKKMQIILEREDLSADERLKLYDQSFTRYLKVHDDYRSSPVVVAPEPMNLVWLQCLDEHLRDRPRTENTPKYQKRFQRSIRQKQTTQKIKRTFGLDREHGPGRSTGNTLVALYIDANSWGEYYDPTGRPPFLRAYVNFMNKHCTSWTYNTIRVQEKGSTVCGHHCIFYLIHRCAGKSMGDVTRTLRHPREATDIVKTFVHRLINKA